MLAFYIFDPGEKKNMPLFSYVIQDIITQETLPLPKERQSVLPKCQNQTKKFARNAGLAVRLIF